jgi:hypothetical protein
MTEGAEMKEHRPGSGTLAWRAGWRYGVAACVGGALDLGVQKVRHLLGWPLASTTWVNWLAIAFPFMLVIIASYRAGRAHGNVMLGSWAGTIAGVIPAAVLGLVTAVYTIVVPSKKLPPPENLKTALIILVMLPFLAAIFGYGLAYVPAWAGRLVFRRHDPQYIAMRAAYIAARAAQPRLSPTERLKQWIGNGLKWVVEIFLPGMGIMGLVLLILFGPDYLATWMLAHLPGWRITLAGGTVALAIALYVAFRSHRYIRIGTNWLALFLLSLGLLLGFPVKGASWILIVPRMVIPILSMWVLIANAAQATIARRVQSTGDDQPLPPVYFHDGGARLTYLPSRRTLALHLLFAGSVSLLGLAIFFIRAVPLGIQLGVGAFGGMALVFGVGHDVARLLVRWPALIVNGEGIIDQGSVGLYGIGLIPWSHVWGLFSTRADLRHGRFAEPHILATRTDSLIAAQPFYKRPLLKLMTMSSFGVPISALVLSSPPEQIVKQITAYIQHYAPADYASDFTEDDEEADEHHSEGVPAN